MIGTLPWILVSDRLPDVNQNVWYFFEITGISSGKYYGHSDEEEGGMPTFGGNHGFLSGDVTHWQPWAEGDAQPPIPEGYSKAERALVHGGQLPFDCPGVTWRRGVDNGTAPKDWAHAAARGAFQSLYNISDPAFRMAMRNTPDHERAGLVAAVAEIIRVAKAQDDFILPAPLAEEMTHGS